MIVQSHGEDFQLIVVHRSGLVLFWPILEFWSHWCFDFCSVTGYCRLIAGVRVRLP